jgi:hypothetical protein
MSPGVEGGRTSEADQESSHTAAAPSLPASKRATRKWKTEKYAVQASHVQNILDALKVYPQVDAFSEADSNRFDRWWGPGSPECSDAFERDWSQEMLWLNPPYSMYARVVDKLERDGAHAVLIIPEWPRQEYFHRAKALEVDSVEFPEGTHLFEMKGETVPALKWPVRAMLVCGDKVNCPVHGSVSKEVEGEG